MTDGAYISGTTAGVTLIRGIPVPYGLYMAYDSAGNVYIGPYIGSPGTSFSAGHSGNLEGFLSGFSWGFNGAGRGLVPHAGVTTGKDYGIGLGTGSANGLPTAGISYGFGPYSTTSWIGALLGSTAFKRDPLVFDLGTSGISLAALPTVEQQNADLSLRRTFFDLDGDGFAERTGWISGKSALLVLDQNNDGLINDGSELFGSSTSNGYTILDQYDLNFDYQIDSSDPIYSSLQMWHDTNGDGMSTSSEIISLAQAGVASISLNANVVSQDISGNHVIARSSYMATDGVSHETAAIEFASDQINTHFITPAGFQLDPGVFDLPDLRGYGAVPDLWVAMSLNPNLKVMAQQLFATPIVSLESLVGTIVSPPPSQQGGATSPFSYRFSNFEDFVMEWVRTGNDNLTAGGDQAQQIAEAFLNHPLLEGRGSGNPSFYSLFQSFSGQLALRFYAQLGKTQINSAGIAVLNALSSASPTDGIAFSDSEKAELFSPLTLAITASSDFTSQLTGFAAQVAMLGYDYYHDDISGDIGRYLDTEMTTISLDPSDPWGVFDSWKSNHGLVLTILDSDGSVVRGKYRAMTQNTALDILRGPHVGITGSSLDETLYGDINGVSNDLIDGREGSDALYGGLGNDTYRFSSGFGNDIIIDAGGVDEVAFTGDLVSGMAAYTTNLQSPRNLTISFLGTGDAVTINDYFDLAGNASVESITFADGVVASPRAVKDAVMYNRASGGNDILLAFSTGSAVYGMAGDDALFGGAEDDDLIGGDGNDVLSGSRGNDILRGGHGSDILKGGFDSDTYFFEGGDGQDLIIEDSESGNGGDDTLLLGAALTSSLATISQGASHNDLIISFDGGSDVVTIRDALINLNAMVEKIVFGDGQVWSYQKLVSMSIGASAGDDALFGSVQSDVIEGLAGDDILIGRSGDDVLSGGSGNDELQGGFGDDIYRFAIGDGQDLVHDDSPGYGYGGDDAIEFGAGIAPGDVVVTQARDGNDLVLTIAGTTDQVTIQNGLSQYNARIETVRFADGTSWSFDDLKNRSMVATGGNDIIFGSNDADAMNGLAGDDLLIGRSGNDILSGGTGNDELQGGYGDDTYRFALGDGQDLVRDDSPGYGYGGDDMIEFGAGIAPGDVVVTQARDGNDLVLTIAGTTDQVTIQNGLSQYNARIETVRFADGTSWSFDDLKNRSMVGTSGNDFILGSNDADAMNGLAGDDLLIGRSGNDILSGGTGNDELQGGYGDDTYRFALGDGQDLVRDDSPGYGYGGDDMIEFGAGIAPGDVVVTQARDGNDLVLTIAGTTDQVTIQNGLSQYNARIETVRFADGTSWSFDDLSNWSMAPSRGSDFIEGSSVNSAETFGAMKWIEQDDSLQIYDRSGVSSRRAPGISVSKLSGKGTGSLADQNSDEIFQTSPFAPVRGLQGMLSEGTPSHRPHISSSGAIDIASAAARLVEASAAFHPFDAGVIGEASAERRASPFGEWLATGGIRALNSPSALL